MQNVLFVLSFSAGVPQGRLRWLPISFLASKVILLLLQHTVVHYTLHTYSCLMAFFPGPPLVPEE